MTKALRLVVSLIMVFSIFTLSSKPVHADNADNLTSIEVTNFHISTFETDIRITEEFIFSVDFNTDNYLAGDIQGGDYFVIDLPEEINVEAEDGMEFNIYAQGDSSIIAAIGKVDANSEGGGTITVTYTDYANDKTNLGGTINLDAIFQKGKVVTGETVELELSTTYNTIAIVVNVTEPEDINDTEVLSKWHQSTTNSTVTWFLRINYAGEELNNIVITDSLSTSDEDGLDGIYYLEDTFSLVEISYASGSYAQIGTVDISGDVVFNDEKTAFTLDLSDKGLNASSTYVLSYDSTKNKNVSELTNDAILSSDTYNITIQDLFKFTDLNGSISGIVPEVSVGDYVWFDANKDGIQDSDESGIAGVTLSITHVDGSEVVDVDGNVVTTTTTDENGYYLFDNLPVGQYVVTVQTPEGYVSTLENIGDDNTIDSSTTSETSVSLVEDGQSDLTLDFGFYEIEEEEEEQEVTIEVPTEDQEEETSEEVVEEVEEIAEVAETTPEVVNTGDENNIVLYAAVGIAALAIVGYILYTKRK